MYGVYDAPRSNTAPPRVNVACISCRVEGLQNTARRLAQSPCIMATSLDFVAAWFMVVEATGSRLLFQYDSSLQAV
jgi:hypothetical protein